MGDLNSEGTYVDGDLDLERAHRLAYAVRRIGGKREAARQAGISESQLYRYLKGLAPPLVPMIALAKRADVSLWWLATGEGPADSLGQKWPQEGPNSNQLDANLMGKVFLGVLEGLGKPSYDDIDPLKIANMAIGYYFFIVTKYPAPADREREAANVKDWTIAVKSAVLSRPEDSAQRKQDKLPSSKSPKTDIVN